MSMKFDNTVTLGNLLSALSMLCLGAAAYANMNERVGKVEQAQVSARETDARHDNDIRGVKSDIKETLGEIKSDIRDLRTEIKQSQLTKK